MVVKEEAVVKPRVTFGEFVRFDPIAVEGKRGAILEGVEGHPDFGDAYRIRTSHVQHVDNEEDPKVILTQSTVFVKREAA